MSPFPSGNSQLFTIFGAIAINMNSTPENSQSRQRHFLIYKPCGYLSQFVNNGQKQRVKKLLGGLHDFPEGIMSIGRLDEHTEGMLLLTTDGKVSAFVNGRKVEKEYYAQVDGLITEEAMEKLRAGVTISIEGKKYLTQPCQVKLLSEAPALPPGGRRIRDARHGPTCWVSITLTEGKYRQVRKMTAVVGFPTLRLARYRVGNHTIAGMSSGEVFEVARFFEN